MSKIKISVVSYLNAKPFIYGLENFDNPIKLSYSEDIPSECARKLLTNEVQLGLIPIAILPELNEYHIVSDYCIGANGKVNSVFILSNTPIQKINKIWLDPHSRTSNNLAKILCKNYWNLPINFSSRSSDILEMEDGEGLVLIGDRTFGVTRNFKYVYDLSEEWERFTGLPFVFAAWVSNTMLPKDFIQYFNEALKFGLANIKVVIDKFKRPDFDVEDYLMNKINYELNDQKRKAIATYLTFCSKL